MIGICQTRGASLAFITSRPIKAYQHTAVANCRRVATPNFANPNSEPQTASHLDPSSSGQECRTAGYRSSNNSGRICGRTFHRRQHEPCANARSACPLPTASLPSASPLPPLCLSAARRCKWALRYFGMLYWLCCTVLCLSPLSVCFCIASCPLARIRFEDGRLDVAYGLPFAG